MWPNPQEIADLVKFTEEILNRKLHFYAALLNKYLAENLIFCVVTKVITSFMFKHFWQILMSQFLHKPLKSCFYLFLGYPYFSS